MLQKSVVLLTRYEVVMLLDCDAVITGTLMYLTQELLECLITVSEGIEQ